MSFPNPRSFVTNWTRSSLPFHEKLLQGTKNTAIKARNRSECCGNHGEVGC